MCRENVVLIKTGGRGLKGPLLYFMKIERVVKRFHANKHIRGYLLRLTDNQGNVIDIATDAEDSEDLFNRGFDLYRSIVRTSGISGVNYDMDKTIYIEEGI